MRQRLGGAEHGAQARGGDRSALGEGCEQAPAALQEDRVAIALDRGELGRAGQGRDDAGDLAALGQDAVDIG